MSTSGSSHRPSSFISNVEDLLPLQSLAFGERKGSFLYLRQLTNSGDFVRTITCKPGMVTILESQNISAVQPFCDALLGRKPDSSREGLASVSLRYGSRELFASEVYTLSAAKAWWRENSIEKALIGAGVAESMINSVLRIAELEEKRELSPAGLTESELRRLTICCALHSVSPVVYLQRPFFRVGGPAMERVAAFIVEAAKNYNKTVLVSHMERIPSSWKSSPGVQVEQIGEKRARKISFGSTEEHIEQAIAGVRNLLALGRTIEDPSAFIVTRPIRINLSSVRAAVPEMLQTEAIGNPSIPGAYKSSQVFPTYRKPVELSLDSSAAAPLRQTAQLLRDTACRQRPQQKHLTEVSVIRRLKRRSSLLRKLIVWKRAINSQIDQYLLPKQILPSKRISEKRRQAHLFYTFVAPILMLMLVLLVSRWFI